MRRTLGLRFTGGAVRSLGFLIATGVLVAILLTGMWLSRKATRAALPRIVDLSARARVPGDAYIGSHVCRECHSNEFSLFLKSGHSRTLQSASAHSVARGLDGRLVADPEVAGVFWSYALAGDQLRVERKHGDSVERFVLDYAFGSGHHATTFLTMTDASKPIGIEHRLTYFGQEGELGMTPGQEMPKRKSGTSSRGCYLTAEITLQCFGCHATQTSAIAGRPFDEGTLIPNVTCERCHGPGRRHVEAARRGEADLGMPFGLGQWTAETQMSLCGECHRHPSMYAAGEILPFDKMLARFQPVGLMQSRCYKESEGALTCVTCHDPHAHASSDTSGYEAACLSCHTEPAQSRCPKSPDQGCLGCHMPRVDLGHETRFTDHWIRSK